MDIIHTPRILILHANTVHLVIGVCVCVYIVYTNTSTHIVYTLD